MKTGARQRWGLAGLVLLGLACLALACAYLLAGKRKPKVLFIAGSSVMYGLNQQLAREFMAADASYQLMLDRGGSEAGLLALTRGAIDLAAVSEELAAARDQPQLRQYLVARNSIAFVVNKNNPVKTVSQPQLRAILRGDIRNWREVGGADVGITLISRSKPAASRQFVEEVVLGGENVVTLAPPAASAEAALLAVAGQDGAVAYLALPEMPLRGNIPCLQVDGVPFSRATILSGRYPYVQNLYLLTLGRESAAVGQFLRFVKSPAAQEIIEQQNFISVR